MRHFPSLVWTVWAAFAVATVWVVPVGASDDPVSRLADEICKAPDLNAISLLISQTQTEDPMQPREIAEAFGLATFLGDMGRCANRQAVADSFHVYKKGKDVNALDIAFAQGRVAAKPSSGGSSAVAGTYQGSFVALGTAGDPPSGQ